MSGRTPTLRWLLGAAALLFAIWLALPLWQADSGVTGGTSPAVAGGDSTNVARGEYLARIGNCAHCHTVRGGQPLAGGRAIETPFGTVISSNISPDPLYGLGRWSADDFWQALHHGQSRDGRLLYPAFPYTSYTRVSREDSDALFAYLQSQPAATRPNEPHRLRWPYSTQTALRVWRALYFTPQGSTAGASAATSTPMERGAYLVEGLGHCQECHSARNRLGGMTADLHGSVLTEGRWYAPSLRTGTEAGVGQWSEEDIVSLLKTGISAKGQAQGPMAEVVLHGTQHLSAADASAMAGYLRSIDSSTAPAPSGASVANLPTGDTTAGARLYQQHCADCHGEQGAGRPGVYPALAGNRAVNLAQPNNLIHAVLHGGFAPATAGNPRPYGMPPLMLTLDDRQAAEVLSFVRSAWGNRGAAVSEFDINSLRR